MSQELPTSSFQRIENISQFSIYFTGNYNEDSEEDIFLKLMFNILKNYTTFTMIYPFTLKEWKLKKLINL